MKIKLTLKEFDFLKSELSKINSQIVEKLASYESNENVIIINLDDDDMIDIRDWASEELQKVGFDESYNLTPSGKILDRFIDIFFS